MDTPPEKPMNPVAKMLSHVTYENLCWMFVGSILGVHKIGRVINTLFGKLYGAD